MLWMGVRADIYRWSLRLLQGERRGRLESLWLKNGLIKGKLRINTRVIEVWDVTAVEGDVNFLWDFGSEENEEEEEGS